MTAIVAVLCAWLVAIIGFIHWQWHTPSLPAPEPQGLELRGGESSRGPDLNAIAVARPALYYTLASIYTYDPEPMSPWLAAWEHDHIAWCRQRGIPYAGLVTR